MAAIRLENATRRGLAVMAEGERRGGDRKSDQSGPVVHFDQAELDRRKKDRAIADNPDVVKEVLADAAAGGPAATVRRVLVEVKKKKARARAGQMTQRRWGGGGPGVDENERKLVR